MMDKHLAILNALAELDGRAPLPEVRKASGVMWKDVNNALRTLTPDYVDVVGYLNAPEYGGNPKILELTDDGWEKAAEYDAPYEHDRFDGLADDLNRWKEYVRRLERQVDDVRRENRRLKKMVLALDE